MVMELVRVSICLLFFLFVWMRVCLYSFLLFCSSCFDDFVSFVLFGYLFDFFLVTVYLFVCLFVLMLCYVFYFVCLFYGPKYKGILNSYRDLHGYYPCRGCWNE